MNKASEVFYRLHGVKRIDVHIATCAKRNNLKTWRELESALLDAFRKRYFELPHYNKVRPEADEKLFGSKPLQKIIEQFEPPA